MYIYIYARDFLAPPFLPFRKLDSVPPFFEYLIFTAATSKQPDKTPTTTNRNHKSPRRRGGVSHYCIPKKNRSKSRHEKTTTTTKTNKHQKCSNRTKGRDLHDQGLLKEITQQVLRAGWCWQVLLFVAAFV